MNEEKQIEEMARDINDSGMLESESKSQIVAEELYAKNWRKQNGGDIAEVVRCKDCKHLIVDEVCHRCYKGIYSIAGGYKVPMPDDFCSYGERRETPNETQTD